MCRQAARYEVLLAHHARIMLAAVELVPMTLPRPLGHEAGIPATGHAEGGAELAQDPVGGEPRQLCLAQVGTVAAPGIVCGIAHHPGAHRIEVLVTNELQPVAVLVHQEGLVAPLEQVTDASSNPVDVAGVAKREVLHPARQGLGPGLQTQVDVIGHEAESVHPVTEPAHALGEQVVEGETVSRGEEDVLARVAAQDNVVERTGDMQAGLAGHGAWCHRSSSIASYAGLTPFLIPSF